ncbi:unnamed protein product [marine sediment metagenome]|uniref:Uncharacterized protein n=1 Tax=marine sediment metagenome TaxID=412755 RepID=X0SSH8_9ZZZZ
MVDFTKIRWAGSDCILITEREHAREPILILDGNDIKKLNDEWTKRENVGVSKTKVHFTTHKRNKKINGGKLNGKIQKEKNRTSKTI